jgi:hypothetical protein
MSVVQQTMAVGWFPEAEWALAVERWPALLDELPPEHVAYLLTLESRLRTIVAQAPGVCLVTVPLTVEKLEARAAAEDGDAADPELRGRLAIELVVGGDGVDWPPGRNDPCWCGSGAKYKRCCGSSRGAPPAPAATTATADRAETATATAGGASETATGRHRDSD